MSYFANMTPKSLQAMRDGASSSAIADYVISPACLSWTLGDSPHAL